ncbi:MAG TPA: GNAT family N-acetyltransferase [Kouleothrix sp.]|uniref:GNAT family N-acetyltransferase n=1 Tax=Kouleothrix sp. TaxID=2779161 RepID=UPI002BB45730|nr:GNAT family N-acetyltransferase [Kouleothrix sp.]
MMIAPLAPANQPAALAYLRALPYRNALPLSNATQLRGACDVLVAEERGHVVGVASTYHDLPIANLTFAADAGAAVGPLLAALADRNPRLRAGPVWALLPADRHSQLARHARFESIEIEFQMVVEPERLLVPANHAPRRLGPADAPHMSALAQAAGLTVWHSSALALGPAFGCFDGAQLVAMAATHFATAEIVEIGHVAAHPDYRRQGYASACTAALAQAAFGLAPRVFLMVLEHNVAALAAYKRLGFRTMERMFLSSFVL